MYKNYFTDKGFTLAEVLVTLSIIGIIAVLTIPSLVQKTQDDSYKTAYKKAFKDANAALMMANSDNKLLPMISGFHQNNVSNFLELKNYFAVAKDCSTNNNIECWPSGEAYNTSPSATAYAFIDSSGRVWSSRDSTGAGGYTLSYFLVDINGMKPPNVYGKDRFPFRFVDKDKQYVDIPITIMPDMDYISVIAYCPSGNCLNTSWLTGAR